MSNPFSGSDIPGMNAMGDTLSFVKKLWGSMQVPGMVAPPMSIDELDKKIQDLKTVESWLTVNMNMLRGTIQALEVQRATIAALQSLGESFAQHAQQSSAMTEQMAAANGAKGDNANWPMHPDTVATQAKETATTTPEPDPDEEIDDDDMPEDKQAAASAGKESQAAPPPRGAASDTNSQFVNPAAWWGLLQEQFKQAVSKAMESEQANADTPAAASAGKPVKKAVAKNSKTPKTPASVKPKVAATGKAPGKTTAKAAAKPASKAAVKSAKVDELNGKTTGKTSKTMK